MSVGTPFKKGNAGKPKGAINKTTKAVKEVFADVFAEMQKDPQAKLLVWGKANPTEFYKLAAKLIPIQLAGDKDNPLPLQVTIVHTNTPVAESEDDVS
jgi:hypothetical protein